MSGPLFPAWLQAEVLQVWSPFALSRVRGHETPKRTLSARGHSAHGDDRKALWVPCAFVSPRSKTEREQATTESPPHRAQKNNSGPIATAESWDFVADTLRQKLPSGPRLPTADLHWSWAPCQKQGPADQGIQQTGCKSNFQLGWARPAPGCQEGAALAASRR